MVDDANSPNARETWDIALYKDSRAFEFNTTGTTTASNVAVTATAASFTTTLVRHNAGFQALSIYGLFDAGVVQMKNAASGAQFFCGTGRLPQVYGKYGCCRILPFVFPLAEDSAVVLAQ